MNKNKEEKHEYLQTIGWSLLFAALFVAVSIFEISIYTEPKIQLDIKNMEIANARLELARLYYNLKNVPENYVTYLKIAMLHETLKEYEQAEINYAKALQKSNQSPFVVYRTALFYIEQRKYKKAIELAELLPTKQNSTICTYKAKLFSAMAKTFSEDGDYPNALKTYSIAYKYAKNTDKKLKEETQISLAKAYIEIADGAVDENDTETAKRALESSIELYPLAQAKYKLGLLYQNKDDFLAQKNIEEAFKLDPEVVNVELYNRLLTKLIEKNEKNGDISKARFYNLKAQQLRRKILTNEIFKGDLKIENFKIIQKRKFLIGKKQTHLSFSIKNNSKVKINNLFLKAELTYGKNTTISGEKKVITKETTLEPNKTADVQIELTQNIEQKNDLFKYADIKIFGRKNIKSKWVLLDFLTINFFK